MRTSNPNGATLLELLVVVAILAVLVAIAIPSVRAYSVEAHLLGAGRKFKSDFFKARTDAIRSGVQTAIRFESCTLGTCYSIYRDGDRDGVLSADIATGRDPRIAGPFQLTGGAPGVRVGINPGVPEIPPARGALAGDPIRFGRARMVSFTPLGGATPGTFYLAGETMQAAVRVNGTTGRVRLMIWRGSWKERS